MECESTVSTETLQTSEVPQVVNLEPIHFEELQSIITEVEGEEFTTTDFIIYYNTSEEIDNPDFNEAQTDGNNNTVNTDDVFNETQTDADVNTVNTDDVLNETQTDGNNNTVNTDEVFNETQTDANTNTVNNCTDETADETTDRARPKKRTKRPRTKLWEKNQAKKLRSEGEAYLGYSRSNEIVQHNQPRPARQMGAPCTSAECLRRKLRQCSRITEDQRKNIFNVFWKQTNWDQRKTFIVNHVDVVPTKRRYTETHSRRNNTMHYFLSVDGEKLEVCKQLFLSTTGLGEFTVHDWLKKEDTVIIASGMSNCSEFNNTTRKRSTGETEKKIFCRKYLEDLPKLESHYGRKKSTKLYLESVIRTMVKLYTLYCEFCNAEAKEPISRCTFTNIFNEMNLSIHPIKKDKCDTCAMHEVGQLSDEEWKKHADQKDRARREKDEDKIKAIKNECKVLTMDLQAIKLSPWVFASTFFYKTKLCSHNFTVYNLASREATCFWFDETAADLTASTFVSCIFEYLKEECSDYKGPIIFYSDGCTYQNRNAILANALLSFAVENKRELIQKFLVVGHTQMECDTVHAKIENELKGREIYLPHDYIRATKAARKNPFPYKAKKMIFSDFKDFTIKKYQRYSSIRPGKVVHDPVVTDLRALRYLPTGIIEYKLDFDAEWEPMPQRPSRSKIFEEPACWPSMYKEERRIKKEKWEHLQQLKRVISEEYHHFYDSLKFI